MRKKVPFVKLHNFIEKIQSFAFIHNNFMRGLFMFFFALEQFMLIIAILIFINYAPIIISIFVVVMSLTFGLEKLFMESRMKYLEEDFKELFYKYQKTSNFMNAVIERHNKIEKTLKTQNLNKENSFKNMGSEK